MSYGTCRSCGCEYNYPGADDDDALSDFVEALMAGQIITARALMGRAFTGEDLARVEKLFTRHARRAAPLNIGVLQ